MSNFKRWLQGRIEKNAVKVSLSWTDSDGVVHHEDAVFKRSQMPLIGDWGRIYPPIDENGRINVVNAFFGGYKNLLRLILVLGIVGVTYVAFMDVFSSYEALRSLPCVQMCVG